MSLEPTNDDRAAWAEVGLEAFAGATGLDAEDGDTKISDLLADLMHLCARDELDFDDLVDRARMNFEIEVEEAP